MGGPLSAFGGPPGADHKSSISNVGGAHTNVDLSPRSHLISQNPETGNPNNHFDRTANLSKFKNQNT